MSGSLNKVILLGNVGRDPEIRNTQSGAKIASFSIATSESWRDKVTNERKESTQWHRIMVYNEKLIDVVEKYVKKGSKVYVEGQLKTSKWVDNQTQVEKSSTDIVISSFKGDLILMGNLGGGYDSGEMKRGDINFSKDFTAGNEVKDSVFSGGNKNEDLIFDSQDEIPF